MSQGIFLVHQVQQEDWESFKDWRRDIKDGGLARHALLPLIKVV